MTAVTGADMGRYLDGYVAIRSRDLERLLELLGPAPEIVTRIEEHVGIDATRAYFTEIFGTDFSNDQDAIFVCDDTVVAISKIRIVGAATGIESEQRVAEAWALLPDGSVRLAVYELDEAIARFDLGKRLERVYSMRAAFETLNAGDDGPIMALTADNVELDRGTNSLDSEPVRGKENLRKFLEPDIFESQTMQIEEVFDAGDCAAARIRFEARAAGSGIEVNATNYQVWQLNDNDETTRAVVYQERGDALAALVGVPR